MAEEQVNSNSAPAELSEVEVNAAAAKEIEQSQAQEVAPGKETQPDPTKATAKTGTVEQPLDAQSLDAKWEKRYKDLQREFTPLSQERAKWNKESEELRSQLKAVQEAFAKATEKPFDLEQFKKDFNTLGPKALEPHVQKLVEARLKEAQDRYEQQVTELRSTLTAQQEKQLAQESKYEVLIRANDQEHYPDFVALYPKMVELAKDPAIKLDLNQDLPIILDELYKMAKSESSAQAVQIAAGEAKKKAEEQVARESRTTVATGGKTASTSSPDLESMPLDKLEALVSQLHGVADRG